MSFRRLLYILTFLLVFCAQVLPAEAGDVFSPRLMSRSVCAKPTGLEDAFHVQVQFYRTIPGQPGVYSVHGPYAFVRERVEVGVRTLYFASGNGSETALATMTSTDGWEIIGDPSGLWDILTIVPNEG